MSTADQDQWREIAQGIRGQLAKYAQRIPNLSPGQVKEFVDACREALWFETNAATFDNTIARSEQQYD